jgi:hypothetical protein
MSEDHLSNEISLSGKLTDNGIEAAAKSRALASIDRLVGSVFDTGTSWFEGVAMRRRAKNNGERQLTEAATRFGIQQMSVDDEFAVRSYEALFRKAAKAQLNKEAVVAEALSDLRTQPPTDEQAAAGPDQVGDAFMDHFERYAEAATTDDLRERWGRILAGEIRAPGTFSPKVLRATDELDEASARIFEALMPFRAGNCISKCILQQPIPLDDMIKLVSAGLVVDPGFSGHSRVFGQATNSANERLWLTHFGKMSVGFNQNIDVRYDTTTIFKSDAGPAMPVYVLTDVGTALSSILSANEENVGFQYARKLSAALPDKALLTWLKMPDGSLAPTSLPD